MKNVTRLLLIIFICLLSLLLIGFGLFRISKSRSFQFFGGLTNRVNTDQKVIALTFDDAPTKNSDEVLKILAEKNVKATFYMIGQGIKDYPLEAKKIAAAGHELGNHSYSHPRFLLKPISFIDREIQQTNTLIRESDYQGEITFRPPYSKKLFGLPWYLKQHHIKTVMCDVEAETYTNLKEGDEKKVFLYNYTVKHTQPGSIILLHPFCDNCNSTRQALPEIIDQLKKDGYRFVTVSELLAIKK